MLKDFESCSRTQIRTSEAEKLSKNKCIQSQQKPRCSNNVLKEKKNSVFFLSMIYTLSQNNTITEPWTYESDKGEKK